MMRSLGLGLMLGSALVAGTADARILDQKRSLYRNIIVEQNGDERCMLFRVKEGIGRESCKLMSQPDRHVFDYTQMMLTGLFLNPHPKRILIIGLGGGTIPMTLRQAAPGAIIDNVEIDQAVVDTAKQYFGFKPDARMRVSTADGRVFVKRAMRRPERYDMVLLDAFDGDYIPEHMLTQEFLKEVRSIMTPDGTIVANTFSTSALYPYESATYKSVFGNFYNLKAGNRVVVTKLGRRLTGDQIKANAQAIAPLLQRAGTSPRQLLSMMSTRADWPANTRVLTDQYSPSNVLNASGN